ncbi:hypothetical protein K9M52_04865 [Arachidicoccus terrestris]|nr:hypothetical protein K9M52_04865 [Arachidicoccus terrestris]
MNRNLHSYLDQVSHLYIADNSQPKLIFSRDILDHPKITIINNSGNEGIAIRINQVAEMAIKEGYDWLLTMDQDSYFDAENIQSYFDYMNDYPGAGQVAMFGVETVEKPEIIADLNEPVDRLITSGSLLNLSLYKEIGPFDEQLFIDEVDHEYCYRAGLKGYRIIQFTHIFLEHQLGESVEVKTLRGGQKTTSFHSPLRLYYMVRNYLYVRRKYKDVYQKDLKIRGRSLLHRIKNNVLYGPDKWKTLTMVFRALSDYKKGKMGKKS